MALTAWFFAFTANAQPAQLRLSVVADAQTTMGVSWTTPADVPSVVEHRLMGGTGAITTPGASAQNVAGVGYVHTVELTGLTSATWYDYRVGDGSQWSGWHSFQTAPPACDPWSFIAVGDDRADPILNAGRGVSPKWGPIAEEAAAGTPPPNLFINSGDLVYDGTTTDQWVDWLDASEPVTAIIPHMPVLGNHDAKGPENAFVFNDVFYLPRNDDEQNENYYAFRYANALFIAFTTASNKTGTATDPRPFARQAAWLQRVLEANMDATWRFLYLHHPLFTSGGVELLSWELGHPPNEGLQNAVLLPLLDQFHVDFVIAGHNHWYERYEALNQGSDPASGQPAAGPDQGTQHLITGGAGAVTLDFDIGGFNPVNIICANVQPGQVQCSGQHHFVRFDIAGNRITMTTTATACQNDNCNHTSQVMDTLTYTKGGADPCAGGSSSSSLSSSSSSGAGSSSGAASGSSASASSGAAQSSSGGGLSSSRTSSSASSSPSTSSGGASSAASGGSTGGVTAGGSSGGNGQNDDNTSCGCRSGSSTVGFPVAGICMLALVWSRRRRG